MTHLVIAWKSALPRHHFCPTVVTDPTSPVTPPNPPSDYAVLRAMLLERGLLRRQPAYFVLKILVNLLLLGAAITLLIVVEHLVLVLFAAAFLAFVYGQIGLLGHDAGHRQIFSRSRWDTVVGYVCSSILGISFAQWVEKHNEHHAHPNRDDMDPDIEFPMLAFSESQAREKRGIFRFIVRHQAVLFFPMLCFTSVSLRAGSVQFLLRRHIAKTWLDIVLFVAHFAVYFTLVFLFLSPLHGLFFILAHQALFGLYLGLVFAPNHKGMPVLEKDAQIDFLREQVLTARNVRSNPLIDFWYGGLNFQIEHHLFPTMPRSRLRKARTIIKDFCAARQIPYYETGMLRSYVEILRYMRQIGRLA
ncbi:MAG: fatty acid desaturase [Candidatus Peregrinibacteria bacterium Greene0416_19]|nr:MAG: fatty acid desaturase [Candidatus Peregrinibacteria bacterium Greene0416_19]